MNKHDFIRAVAVDSGETIKTVECVLRSMDCIILHNALAKEETVTGLFKIKNQAKQAKTCRNPSNGKEIQIPAKTVVKFTAMKALKDAANGGVK